MRVGVTQVDSIADTDNVAGRALTRLRSDSEVECRGARGTVSIDRCDLQLIA